VSLRDGWSKVSVRIEGEPQLLLQLSAGRFANGVINRSGTVLSVPVSDEPDAPLQQRLETLLRFLHENEDVLGNLPRGSSLDVFVGWSPASPQEALTITRPLLHLLSTLHAELVFDTYGE